VFLGWVDVTTDGSGNANFAEVLAGVSVTPGHSVTATATVRLGGGNFGATSEFAANCIATAAGPGITVTPASGLVTSEAGGTATFTVVLDTAPTADVTIALAVSDGTEGSLSTNLLTFTSANWNVAQTVTVTGLDDTWIDGNAGYTVLTAAAASSDVAYNGRDAADVALANSDDDTVNTLVVTTASDVADGDTSSIGALLSNLGADNRVSLREAIIATNNTANGAGGADRIHFQIADALAGGAHTIVVQPGGLASLFEAVTIDGTTDADFTGGAPVIALDGSASGGAIGLRAIGDGVTIRGLAIGGFSGGIRIDGDNALVVGNRIGTDVTGSVDRGNAGYGIELRGTGAQVGGLTAAAGNLVSGNDGVGINVYASGNTLQGNMIGLALDGVTALGNTQYGVFVGGANNVIGGYGAGPGNVIAANGWAGVSIGGAAASGNSVLGNRIGTDAFGAAALGNGGSGIEVLDASNNVVSGNVVSGNAASGVRIDGSGSGADGNRVQGNYIGTNAAGTAALGNAMRGVDVLDATNSVVSNNLISGNADFGVLLGGTTSGSMLTANVIGLNAAGSAALANLDGIVVTGAGNLIGGSGAGQGNVVSGNTWYGVWLTGASATGNRVEGNLIGTDVSGSAAVGNGAAGVYIDSGASGNTVGGVAAGARNVISGNAGSGVRIDGIGTAANVVRGNFIGTDAGGSSALGNAQHGVHVSGGAVDSRIVANLIAGNMGSGIRIDGSGTDRTVVQGNSIGTDAAGGAAIANAGAGIEIVGVNADHVIGGALAAERNLVSGNAGDGIAIRGFGVTGVVIEGNRVGTDAAGTAAVGNAGAGVSIQGSLNTLRGNLVSGNVGDGIVLDGDGNLVLGNSIGTDVTGAIMLANGGAGVWLGAAATNHRVGGTVAGERNRIAFNTGAGIKLDASARGNALLGNSIEGNGALGIDLNADGVTANDVLDADGGANNGQNHPLLAAANHFGGVTTVTGSIATTPNATLRIEFFANAAGSADPSGYGEGAVYLGYVDVTTDASGNASFSVALAATVSAGDLICANATVDLGGGNYGDTSEFSANVAATSGNQPPLNTVPGVQVATEDTPLAIGGISVADAQGNLAGVTLGVGNGTLTVTAQGTVTVGGNGSATLTLSGSQADINATLATLGYLGNADFNGSDTLTVTSTDAFGASDSDAVAITVAAVNDAPVATSGAAASLGENQTVVTTVTSTDIDGGTPIYSVAGGADAARFAIDAASGQVTFVAAPDFEAPADADADNVYQLTVAVDDGNGGTVLHTLALTVTNVNEAPGSLAPAAASVDEDAAAGTLVATLSAIDPDAGDTHAFSLVDDAAGRFVVDAASGALRVAPGAVLDFETASSHTLLLRVTDAQGLTTEWTIVVTLRDVAEPAAPSPPSDWPPSTPAPAPATLPPPTTGEPAPASQALASREDRAAAAREPGGSAAEDAPRSAVSADDEADDRRSSASSAAPIRLRAGNGVQPIESVRFGADTQVSFDRVALDLEATLPSDETSARRLTLAALRGSSVEADSDDADLLRGRGADESTAITAALQDPVHVVSATLTAGFVWWLTRSGGLLTSILMGIPAWRHVDLLPVLASRRADDSDDDGLGDAGSADASADEPRHSAIDELFSRTSRLFGESKYLS
jgi:hypothetical protein